MSYIYVTRQCCLVCTTVFQRKQHSYHQCRIDSAQSSLFRQVHRVHLMQQHTEALQSINRDNVLRVLARGLSFLLFCQTVDMISNN